jgi:hypothetical protein
MATPSAALLSKMNPAVSAIIHQGARTTRTRTQAPHAPDTPKHATSGRATLEMAREVSAVRRSSSMIASAAETDTIIE